MAEALVVGVGNELRGDDAAGLLAARRVRAVGGERVVVVERRGEAAALIESWQGHDAVVVIDAMRSGRPAGAVVRFDATAGPLPAIFDQRSTHQAGVVVAVELGRALGRLPGRLTVYGIEVAAVPPGPVVSPEVRRGVEEAAALVLAEVAAVAGAGRA